VGESNLSGIQLVRTEVGRELARAETLMNIPWAKKMTMKKILKKVRMKKLIQMERNLSGSYIHVRFLIPGMERSHCANGHLTPINGV
jgi:hypothetical protein